MKLLGVTLPEGATFTEAKAYFGMEYVLACPPFKQWAGSETHRQVCYNADEVAMIVDCGLIDCDEKDCEDCAAQFVKIKGY